MKVITTTPNRLGTAAVRRLAISRNMACWGL
jgi:hypothetical protein